MQRSDSELLFGEDEYHLLRDDSFLQRIGSTNFHTLLETADIVAVPELKEEEEEQQQTQQQQTQQQHNQQQQQQTVPQQVAYPIQNIDNQLILANPHIHGDIYQTVQVQQQPRQQQRQLQQLQPGQQIPWDSLQTLDTENVEVLPSSNVSVGGVSAAIALIEGSTSCLADSTLAHSVPSLQPWAGRHKFGISLPTGNKDRNKWCYSQDLGKLYLCPNVAVPVNVTLDDWVNANITMTPVFKQSCHRTDPVNRCYNCKSIQNCDPNLAEHLVQVEGEGCDYSFINDRYMVTVPLRPPPPGEVSSTLLIKIMCLTSCVGGPNRRPFCIVLTLRNSVTGEEIGRQILDIKCCKCPSRDLTNDEKSRTPTAPAAPSAEEEKRTKVRKLATEIAVGQKRKRPKIKLEPGTDSRMVNIAVPIEYEAEVKSYINKLIAADLIKKWQPDALMYPEEESN
ncbi:cellular tumor antigen p53-like isoform X3 [Penaeus monodon]|uniref:p53 n=2 Tax=Penaeus monodon TaxID=6687 RepID=A0A192ABB0_PENMO|nr:cellular tumor antigen p53-like isoform X3 [Penaeus monodon]XP_037794853.1 cellular tumor antigen p53-like isoform X3 [Penaeus monodon]XP_037794854.1 cellular tumor antigen p53-like isoform X3 [Penaeus monodon]XP_037794855.1 cellular tumor antigen p53-like isoform X3 [Penaeus monodon]XP_037794856.1 cellular tumor antigen p53-like isoform X3 [Penaeus monodon]ANJ77678.1 p53 [Penaeus monodon]